MYTMNIDIVFFVEVCHEFVTQMCCPCVIDEAIETEEDDMEQGTDFDDEEECMCNLCAWVRTCMTWMGPSKYNRRFKLD